MAMVTVRRLLACAAVLAACCAATDVEEPTETTYRSPVPADLGSVYLWETFDDEKAADTRWVRSAAVKADGGRYDGEWSVEATVRDALPGDLGLVLKTKARHAAISTPLSRPFLFSDEPTLVVQYEVQFQVQPVIYIFHLSSTILVYTAQLYACSDV